MATIHGYKIVRPDRTIILSFRVELDNFRPLEQYVFRTATFAKFVNQRVPALVA
ncbi:MAG: hypothetical protein ABR880_21275 [Candidatus Sulfotelmatobacter sp.]